MAHAFHDIAFTETVKSLQGERGSRASYARFEGAAVRGDIVGPDEAAFIAARDSFYMASTSATGWPYVQHRGGPPGFVRVLDERTLGFAEFAGNKQYISLGNLQDDDRVSLIFMDYPNRARLKLFGHAAPVDPDDGDILSKLALPGHRARIERGMIIRVAALDWNCPQHITPRYSEAEVKTVISAATTRIAELEGELARMRRASDRHIGALSESPD